MANSYSLMRSVRQDRAVLDHEVSRATVRRILAYAVDVKGWIAALAVLSLLTSLMVVATPLLLQRIIDDGVAEGRVDIVIWLSLIVAVLAVLEAGTGLVQRYVSAHLGETIIRRLRTQIFAHVTSQPLGFFTATRTGSLVNRVNSDIIGAQNAFSTVVNGLFGTTVTVVGILTAMVYLSWQITVIALMITPLLLWPINRFGRRLQKLARERMQREAAMSEMLNERFSVAGALLVKLYGRPDEENAEFEERVARVGEINTQNAVYQRLLLTSLTFIAAIATALAYGIGGYFAIQGTMTVGSLLAIATLLARLFGPLTSLANIRLDFMTATVSFERVFELLDLQPSVKEPAEPEHLPAGSLGVRLLDVHYSYPKASEITLADQAGSSLDGGVPVLRGVDLDIAAGTVVALVGPSGSGKSTLASLILRLADPTAGSLEIGGVNARSVRSQELRQRVSMVPQDSHMFHDTLSANLRYARPDATDAELHDVLFQANLEPVVAALPDGLNTVLGDRGHRLSGGEKQRLAIARLLLKAPDVVVLDEATAHLDSESEAAVQSALTHALRGRTAVVIAHRLSTIRSADAIAVIDDGMVREYGTHDELLGNKGLYADLYRTQFAGQGNTDQNSGRREFSAQREIGEGEKL